ncbi:MAG: hypothetical protein ACM3YE_13285 [Bacteroidota bacterium]
MKLASEDEFIRGAIAGSISAIAICLALEVLEKFSLVEHCWLFMAGEAVMQFKHSIWQAVFAFLIHLGVGVFWGVIIAFLFSKVFSDRYYILKGLVFGLTIFFLHLGLLDKALHYPAKMREETLTVFFIFLSYLLYGMLTAFILKKVPGKEQVRGG